MLREDWTAYDGSNGYTWAPDNQHIQVNLRMTYIINTIKLLLWDQDNRYYNFNVEVSADQATWTSVLKGTQCKSWQEIQFKATPVKYIRLYGTGGSGHHNRLHIVKFMAYFD